MAANRNGLNEGSDKSQVSSNTRRLKLKAADCKYRLTDVVGIEGMFQVFRLANL